MMATRRGFGKPMARDHIDFEGVIPAYMIDSCAPAKQALFSPAAA
jgi:hypothetical protein